MSDLSKTCETLGDAAAGIVLQAPVSDLDGYWLELQCCSGTTLLPCRLVVTRWGGEHRLVAVLDRLKCKLCKGPPVRAWLNETPTRIWRHGAEPGWSVQLIGATTAEAAE